jgi:hypothetical protein
MQGGIMNIESARAIPMTEILDKLGLQPTKKKQRDYWYNSPFRSEKTPSFKVNIAKNTWYDFGEGEGGDSIAFVCAYLKRNGTGCAVPDALRWLRNMFQGTISIYPVPEQDNKPPESNLVLKSVEPLAHVALVRYLESRGITQTVANDYLKEICIYNKGSSKHYFAAAIKNEEGGYDYRNPYFKGCVKKKSITFVRGLVPKPEGIHIFEGFMDFLSAIVLNKGRKFNSDTIILNSLSCMREATGYIRNYGYAVTYTWLDNDEAGKKATQLFHEFLLKEKIRHIPMNKRYAQYKDVNEWHMKTYDF